MIFWYSVFALTLRITTAWIFLFLFETVSYFLGTRGYYTSHKADKDVKSSNIFYITHSNEIDFKSNQILQAIEISANYSPQERSVSDSAGAMGIDRAETSSPRRSLSLSAADTNNLAGWKRPWLSQVCNSLTVVL